MRRVLACMFAALTLAFGAGASTAAAQTNQTGLVNISVSNTTIQLPIALAANVCDVNVAILSTLLAAGPTQCGADATAEAVDTGGGGGATNQTGLVNVSISDTVVQVPIAFAINVCDVNAAVLALLIDGGTKNCDAAARSGAQH
jgi:hypothetical protein